MRARTLVPVSIVALVVALSLSGCAHSAVSGAAASVPSVSPAATSSATAATTPSAAAASAASSPAQASSLAVVGGELDGADAATGQAGTDLHNSQQASSTPDNG